MAKRNRKNGHEGNRTIFWGISFSMLIAALAMVYLSLFNTCDNIGRQIKKLEHDRAELHKQVVNEERNWAMARVHRQHGTVDGDPWHRDVVAGRAEHHPPARGGAGRTAPIRVPRRA